MPARVNAVDEAEARARHQLRALIRDLRMTRVGAGLSQAVVAHAIGLSRARLTQWEQGMAFPDPLSLARWGAVLGLDIPFRGYPGPAPLRDQAQLRILARARLEIAGGWTWRTEVPVGTNPQDRRAIDAVISGNGVDIGLEIISRLADCQAQVRAALLKQEAAGLDRMVLVLSATRHNRQAVLAADATLRPAFPLDTRAVLGALRRDRMPAANGVVLL
jgi:transcriptional regulator with XRE-family HTH domain